ncbi:DUF1206 domain-containing protein [Modestobacter sp. I12A-02628]|uniref:DUF1206 domain-containing protein n=1 Tax=Goekera deserti TaxID=2497753 RepID=A0A7K3WDY4_9ACTN|nr:DUF1206 domain-containing protein [Goekera deserti]MPQ97213.1 DUF1206 domain-containing protein [Goekera deserti]NDI46469.1 DUF1206 domain-containing protein [Goekera deserti]NEL54597.1 DUF1206 domain-containing protein [Goekera deserti]
MTPTARALIDRVHRVVEHAREVTDHPVLEAVARVGLVAYGLVHLLIGWLALQLARGSDRTDADQTGALQTVADSPGGVVALWLIGLGLLALALWQAGEVLLWWRGLLSRERWRRTAFVCAKCLAKAAVYAVLGGTALLFAAGGEYQADERLRELTGETLEVPGGTALVVAVAVGVVAVGLYTVLRGCTGGFMKDIDLTAAPDRVEPWIEAVGRVGYVAKGIAFGLAGVLLVQAARTADLSAATGLDGALTVIAGVPGGSWLLGGVAAGFAAFGVYALGRARYPDRDPSS